MRAVVYGVMNPDIVHRVAVLPQPGDDLRSTSWQITLGGKAANVAAALATWEVDTRLLGLVIGVDPLAEALLDALRRPHLDLGWVKQDPAESTRHCVILVAPDGDRTIVCAGYEGAAWQEVPEEAWEGVDLVVIDGFGGDAAATVAATAVARGLTTVWLDAPDPPPVAVDLVVWSRHEHSEGRAAALGDAGQRVALTAGRDAVTAWIDRRRVAIAPPSVAAVNATGAGDVFAAGAAYRLAAGDPPEDAVRWAASAGAAVVARPKGVFPTAAEVSALHRAR